MLLKKLSLLLQMVIVFFLHGVSQVNAPEVIPPSPKSQEYAKYINYQVSMYNGLPDITIPLYTIKIKGLDIPVNLSYHASGIKFGQDNGEVGCGWNLSPGYRVSRTVYGFADERQPMPSYMLDSLNYYDYDNGVRDKYLSKFIINDNDNRPKSFNSELLDGEYDMFNVNLASEGGTFIITDRTNKTVTSIERSNLQVNYNTGSNTTFNVFGITGFELTDESGIKYYAGEALPQSNNYIYETNSSAYGVASAWAITDIINPIGEKVHFKYSSGIGGGWKYFTKNFTVAESVTIDPSHAIPLNHSTSEGVATDYTTFFLDEINSENEQVKFSRNETNLITKAEVFSPTGILLKTINFYYTSYSLPGVSQTLLDSVKVSDQNNNNVETYKFDYNTALPGSSFVADQWGYYLPVSNFNNLFHDQFGNDQVLYTDNPSQPATVPTNISYFLTERSQRDNIVYTPDFFALKRITYPTGGNTEYEYESNKYLDPNNMIRNGGGLRVKRIKSNDLVNSETLIRDYVYGTNEGGYGLSANNQLGFDHRLFVNEGITFRHDPTDNPFRKIPQRVLTYSTNVQGDIDPGGFLSSYVIYPEVTEYYGSISSSAKSGKVIYKYDPGLQYSANSYPATVATSPPYSPGMQYHNYAPLYVSRYRSWDKPALREKECFLF